MGPLSADPEIERAQAVLAARLLGDQQVPTRIGRYVMLDRVGAGAMGVVYSAYDDQLDRRVAIKLLHRGIDVERVRRRLQREAQTMARLNHENVAQVFEVGEHRGRAFVAMEFVDGSTLRQWQDGTAPAEIIASYLRAARGLAAAHAAGIVHRDFKPDNVLVGDGRVCVVDFGLARIDAESTEPELDVDPDKPLASTLSRTGAIAGTPAYMAPEQFRGDAVGPAADQFAFCVALFEALAGHRPYEGDSPLAIYENVIAGRLRRSAKIPARLASVLARGLSPDVASRWPDMHALSLAIARDPSRWRRRAGYVVAGMAVIAGIAGASELSHAHALATCDAIAAPWADADAQRVRDGLLATNTAYAQATVDRVLPALDAYARAWSEASGEACRAQVEQGTPSDASAWCLDERRVALQATIDQLAQADTDTVARAVTAVAALPRIETCRSVELLARLPVPPSTHRDQIAAVRGSIVRADVIGRAGHHEQALTEAEASIVDAQALDWPPLSAAAHNGLGQALHAAARYREAEEQLSTSYFEALRAGAFEIAVAASTTLVDTVGVRLGRHADGLAWSRHAETALARLDDPDGLATARWLERAAQLRLAMFHIDEALALSERALEIREAALGPDHPDVGDTVFLLASVKNQYHGKEAGPEDLATRALEIAEASLGPEHPDLVPRLDLLADVDPIGTARPALLDRAIAIGERSLGPDHPVVAKALVSKARVVFWQSGPAAAQPLLERALAIQEAKLGEHQDVAVTLNLLGMMRHPTQDAVGFYQRAIVITEKEYGPDHPFVAPPLFNLAEIAMIAGDFEKAVALQTRASEVRKRIYGAADNFYRGYAGRLAAYEVAAGLYDRARTRLEDWLPDTADAARSCDVTTPTLLGELELRAGDPLRARTAIDRALASAWNCPDPVQTYASSSHFGNWVLARVLWDLPEHEGRDRARALRLARGALETWRALPKSAAIEQWAEPCPLWCTSRDAEIARIEAWLSARA